MTLQAAEKQDDVVIYCLCDCAVCVRSFEVAK